AKTEQATALVQKAITQDKIVGLIGPAFSGESKAVGAISAGNYPMVFVVGIVMFGVVYSATNAIWPSFYGEMFTTQVRLSGMAVGTQIGFAVSGFVPAIANAIRSPGNTNWVGVAVFTAGLCLVNVIAVASGRETYQVPTERLGEKSVPELTRA
ncbi:MFS transporter, partial [Kibdelosporangium lantanae]